MCKYEKTITITNHGVDALYFGVGTSHCKG